MRSGISQVEQTGSDYQPEFSQQEESKHSVSPLQNRRQIQNLQSNYSSHLTLPEIPPNTSAAVSMAHLPAANTHQDNSLSQQD
jgi:hypothetical protein